MSVVAVVLAWVGLIDLFTDPPDRAMPWWGDLIAIGVAVVISVMAQLIKSE